jgi:VWFA-related protein
MRSRLLPLVLAAALTAAPPSAAQEPSFDRAAALEKAGELEKAAAEYRRFLEAHPANVEANSNLGVVLVRLGRYEEAMAAYETALASAPSNATVRLNLGLAFYKAARLEDALAAFGRVLAAQPDNLQAKYLAADCHLRLGRPAETVTLLQPLESSRADDPVLSYLLGMAYLATKQPDKGQLLIDRILRHGDSAQARVMMGLAKRAAGDMNGAAEDLKRAVELDPELPGVHGMYALTLLGLGNPDLARREFDAELSRNPLDFDANLNVGVLLKTEQDYDAALKHLNRALGVRPGDIATRYQIAGIALARQDTANATAMLEAIVKEAPSFVEAHVALATAYYRQQRRADGDRERAIVERLNQESEAKERARSAQSQPPPARAQEPAAERPVVRAGATAVMLDVVVRDKHGRPVRDLQQGEMTVLEDGVAREIHSFRLVERAGAPAAAAKDPTAGAGIADARQYPTLVTLVFDHLTQNGRTLARRAALKFLAREMPANQWVAVFALEQRLSLTQPFTQDAAAVRRAIERATIAAGEARDRVGTKQDDRDPTRAADAAVAAAAAARPSVDTAAVGASVSEARVAEVIARIARMVEAADLQQRGQSTLFPLMTLMKAQGTLAGRKALILFSEGVRVPPNLEEAYRSAISEANRANVSIYAVDARGLDTGRALDQSRQLLDKSGRNSQAQLVSGASQRPVTLDDVLNSETAEGALRADTQNALRALAEETSGTLIANTNDLGSAIVERVQPDLDSYYEIGYTPAPTPPDGRFRSLDVKSSRRDLTVRSRSGYFALPDTDAAPLLPYELPMLSAAAANPPPRPFEYAVGAFRFGTSSSGLQHTLVMEVPLEHLTFEENRSKRTYTLRFTAMALVKNQSGQVVQRFSESYPLEGPLDRLDALKRGRLRFKRQFSLPPGRYTIVTVARDQPTERSSVAELPLDVPEVARGVRLSDLSVIRTVDQTSEAPDPVEDPFRTGTIRVVPNLDLPISKATNTQISAYVTLYPDVSADVPSLTFEFSRDGAVIGRSAAALPKPDDEGRIKYVASFPTDVFAPGRYDLRAIATQGSRSVSSTAHFVLIP